MEIYGVKGGPQSSRISNLWQPSSASILSHVLNFITTTESAKQGYFPHSDNLMMLLFFDCYKYEFVFTNNRGKRSSLLFKESEYDVA